MKMNRRRSKGFSLVDTMVCSVVLSVALGGFGMNVVATQQAALKMHRRDMVRAQGIKYMERLLVLPFGTAADPAPTAGQVAQFFADSTTVTGGAPITLKSLQTVAGAAGWRFRVAGFEEDGAWEVEINTDLDGNCTNNGVRGANAPTTGYVTDLAGDGTSVVALHSEGDPLMLRIEIFFKGVSVMRSMRAAPVEGS